MKTPIGVAEMISSNPDLKLDHKQDAKHDTKHDILQHLLKRGEVTAQDLAEKLDISPQAIRKHLKDLETEGLIYHTAEQLGMGRPQFIYALTAAGRDRFPDSYNQFAVNFLDTLIDTLGKEQVSEVLQKQWQRKAQHYKSQLGSGSLKHRLEKLAEIRRAEGYVTEWFPVEGNDQQKQNFIFTEYNCAIAHVAESFPSVCGHELEMFATVLDCPVERTHWMVDGEHRCGYLIHDQANSC
ncbi:iron-sulfur cluster biosynthesis transcriptional regulator SufR [Pseudanabaena sp. FACHB-723]|uniref:Iron-sulfur cluster biosynthesis transcriptional regulator SufR n=2 Tax=Pseudanabaena mucicola TaxID=71190 RepID=A0ABR7ZXE2_9CYAN|nr:iron-sulfur cluster biosynthesis transcriptional regulator SufR [Pseudanabaena mucicola]MBD2188497.1 iron-sulfur cluster biosynthesis transcriptional regulator SufR [Pseudanabaena mucicola FACHB-723]